MSNLLTDKIKNLFLADNKNTLIITIGNPLRSDDGVGPYIYEHIRDSAVFNVLNAGDRPESIIDEAVELKPAKTIIIDAAGFDGKIGEIRIIPQDLIPDTTISTHAFPLNIIANILKQDTGSEVYFLGIQASNMDFKEGICREVKESADQLIKLINSGSKSNT